MHVHYIPENCASLSADRIPLTIAAADVLYFDAVMHFLQLGAPRRFGETGCHLPTAELLNASVTDLISLFRVRFGDRLRVVFFETHDLCIARYDGGWSADLDLLDSDPAQFVRHCRDAHAPFADVKDALLIESGRANLTELCLKATFTPAGTRYVTELVHRALHLILGIIHRVDGHAISKCMCWATEDGRHYIPLLHLEVARLLDIALEQPSNASRR